MTENKNILIQGAIQLKVEGIVTAKLKTDGTWIDVRRHMIANGYALDMVLEKISEGGLLWLGTIWYCSWIFRLR